MNLLGKIKNDIKNALKQQERRKLSVLKLLSAAITNEEIRLGKKETGLTDEEILKVIKSEAKKRKDSIEAYTKAGRNEMANEEKEELLILGLYLPPEMPDEEIEKIVKEAIKETGAGSMADFGKVMKIAMEKIKGQADGNRVGEIAKKFLNNPEKN